VQEKTAKPRAAAPLSRFSASACVACLAFASYWSIRFARADLLYRANTPGAISQAIELDPWNARYRAWQAELEEHEGRDPRPALLAASRLNARDSSIWTRLGLEAEIAGDYARAEEWLLEAARVDRLSGPRITLMHYYFRRGDWAHFWKWSRRALEMSYGDAAPLFRLCWTASQDAGVIRSRAIPDRPAVLVQYLGFLLSEGRLDAAGPVSFDVLRFADPDQARLLMDYCDRLIERGKVAPALAVWNAMCRRKLTPYPPLAPESGSLLTNGDFAAVPLRRGFDWHFAQLTEVAVARLTSPAGLQFALSGKQAERCELLWQYLPVVPHRLYRLRWWWRTLGMPADAGIRWQALNAATSQPPGENWQSAELTFASGEAALARLSLVSEREAGTARPEGSVFVRNVTLEAAR
jgi:tetratricopeptide (TPR) repeat protein